MATNWTVLAGRDMNRVLSQFVMVRANENTQLGSQPSDSNDPEAVDETEANRRDQVMAVAVAELRAAIQAVGVQPLSVTPGAVPPGSVRHVLNLAAYQLVNSTPNLQMAVIDGEQPFMAFYEEAVAHIAAILEGKQQVVLPTDPTGEDYLTAVDADTNPAINTVRWGDAAGTDADHALGYKTVDGSPVPIRVLRWP